MGPKRKTHRIPSWLVGSVLERADQLLKSGRATYPAGAVGLAWWELRDTRPPKLWSALSRSKHPGHEEGPMIAEARTILLVRVDRGALVITEVPRLEFPVDDLP